ncbi:DUF4262 domain-containing protein [uncultured Winogradskyella sp.]|uniref:DUF4262 domain-containing protein n=1 Tax=uncultured Winogradskyella sp. TaxID=395353 RepID=UPI002618DEB9|nr:DUF4262 domain-containing protein [uncultured Winogradskyella sp.]
MTDKKSFKKKIKSNIEEFGYHVTLVTSSTEPRYAYTIGLYQKFGLELVFAGGIFYMKNQVLSIFKVIIDELNKEKELSKVDVQGLGTFTLSKVDKSWSELMLLGVYDFFDIDEFKAIQVCPDKDHFTLDIPDLSKKFEQSTEPVWKWLNNDLEYPVSQDLTVVTNLDALQGEPITEIMRWEEDEFEMFAGAGPDVEKEDVRVVPLATILSIDNSISDALKLEVGKGFWREDRESNWNNWG